MTSAPHPLACYARDADRPALGDLFEAYLAELSQYGETSDARVYLDLYWQAPDRLPYLINHDGRIAGFVLVNTETVTDLPTDHAIAEFYVCPDARRLGLGQAAARQVFRAHPGQWEVAIMRKNTPALAFWDKTLRQSWITRHEATRLEDCVMHRFMCEAPE